MVIFVVARGAVGLSAVAAGRAVAVRTISLMGRAVLLMGLSAFSDTICTACGSRWGQRDTFWPCNV